jgi:hypothetical protein
MCAWTAAASSQGGVTHLALGVVEVSGHSDDGLLNLVVQELGRVSNQLAQDLWTGRSGTKEASAHPNSREGASKPSTPGTLRQAGMALATPAPDVLHLMPGALAACSPRTAAPQLNAGLILL